MKNTISNLKSDLPASLVVFLVALPLCLGVALASGAPLLSGIIAGIIGGIVVGFLSQSPTSVSGPAAGLAAVVLAAISELGTFENFLLAGLIAGGIQLILGLVKGGFVANYIPSNVIKGLLAAIGIILILKQIPHAVGFDQDPQDDFSFFQTDGDNTFSALLDAFNHYSMGAIIISIISIATMLLWDRSFLKRVRFFPSSLFVVLLGVFLNWVFTSFFVPLEIHEEHLVHIPPISNIHGLITFPAFSGIGNVQVWFVGITVAIIASLETLLNLEAVENLDPHKRFSSPNRELIAQGIGNIFSSLIGGLPITSVVVRGSVNIQAGSNTKLSTILHGFFLLVSILFLSQFLNMIPLASLACILLLTGYKLTKVSIFKEMWRKGFSQFIPFVATILAIVFTDLLIGVLIGLGISIFYLLKSNLMHPFVLKKETMHQGEALRLELPSQVSFLNKATIKETLWELPAQSQVTIDASHCKFVDNDVLETIADFQSTVAKEKGIQLNIVGLKAHYDLEDSIQFVNVLDQATQQRLRPEEVIEILKKGNARFISGNWNEKNLMLQVTATATQQSPFAIVLSCIDSRTAIEQIFDLGLGDIFSIRIAGNIVNEDILGSMEYAINKVGTKVIIVLGHTGCGAITGACSDLQMGNLTALLSKIKPAIQAEKTVTSDRSGANPAFVNLVAIENVHQMISRMRAESSIIADLERAGTIAIVGGIYRIDTGKVDFFV